MRYIVLFDGECNVCDRSVQFIMQRDPNYLFQFASLQSEVGRSLLRQYHVPYEVDSIVLLTIDQYYLRSTAALRIAKQLKGPIRLVSVLRFVPRPIRDYCYQLFANYRYRFFGKKQACMIPKPEDKQRFIDIK
ncbi:hypothetical protein J416_13594 [Gracilibacillus halophilus YIM-C55.5]|uniref:Thiol-disulfide oxidoreductase n=1 Tax=Gracilibacillus halophilus YIM-C55.5 TaxID=1308866 RepID=N4W9I4_9BACI|nr:DCC1-like thiol-disulfide oxidoreductase family protein [Gracilibacillus halophilus]ENH95919.1 hypothetical protein J416_13594 [Gracilibacillus halophilus YIM-C55.5]